jgi:hypothetical protein
VALAQYDELFWYPSGTIAAGIPARVFELDSNTLAVLWADAAGTVPLANPTATNGAGRLIFWAEEGEYWLHLDSESFRVRIGPEPIDPASDIAAAALSTGVTAGGDLSVNAVSSSAIDIAPLTGYITDFTADPFAPSITRVVYPGGTVEMDAGALARTATAWLMDADQVITQQSLPPSNAQRRTHIFLGVTAQVGGVVVVDQSLPVIMQQPANQLTDLMTALGAFNISGNLIAPNGANLMVDHTAGELFSQAFNHFVGPVQTNDPHVSTTVAQTPANFRYATRDVNVQFGPLTSLVDVANYDVGGVVTPVGGGANTSTVHRVFMFANNNPDDQIVFQYGQTTYSSLMNAVNSIGAGTFTPNPLMRAAAFLGHIAVARTATNLSDPTQAVFVRAGKFATP